MGGKPASGSVPDGVVIGLSRGAVRYERGGLGPYPGPRSMFLFCKRMSLIVGQNEPPKWQKNVPASGTARYYKDGSEILPKATKECPC